MRRFEVWGPLASKMAIQINGAAIPMEGPDDRGYWQLELSDVAPGSDYGYLIDEGEAPYPDPRSRWQPHGVHGLSRVYDQNAFDWTDARFEAPPLATAIVYELHVGTFTERGTLDAAIEKLDYLARLGISHVELMPVAAFSGDRGWGYDGVALYAVHEPYGGPDALKRFVNAAHAAGVAVLLDVVYNHFGPLGNYAGKFGPYITDTHHTPWGGAVNLDSDGAREVRRFFCDNALMWMRDFHIDGLRIDAIHTMVDRSAIHFLEQLERKTKTLGASLGRRLVLIAESDLNDPRVVTAQEAGGYSLDAQWNDDFHHALFTVLSHEPEQGYFADFGTIGHLAKALEQTFVYNGIYSQYRNRVHGRSAAQLSQHRFFGFIQNHDQVGNRATGDRIGQVVGLARAKMAAALVLLGPFVPLIFQGEEWAASTPFQYFADHDDPEMARLVSEGRKREFAAFGWNPSSIPDPEKRETFERSKLDWSELGQGEHAEMLAWYRDLIRLRRKTPSLNDGEPGNTHVVYDEEEKWFYMQRGNVRVCCNLGPSAHVFPVAPGSDVALASRGGLKVKGRSIALPPDTVAVLIAAGRSEVANGFDGDGR